MNAAEFITVAEETGLVLTIGRWVFAEACRQLAEWRRGYPDLPLIVRVNMSPAEFAATDLVEFVENCLSANDIPGERLCIEITEYAVVDEPEKTANILRGFREIGVEVAIDDFGTGFASMTELKHLPVDLLKLDMSFVEGYHLRRLRPGHRRVDHPPRPGPQPRRHRRGHRARRHHRGTADLGCHRGQGYLISRPVAPGRSETVVERGQSAGVVASPRRADPRTSEYNILTPFVDGASERRGGRPAQYEPWLFQTMLDELSVVRARDRLHLLRARRPRRSATRSERRGRDPQCTSPSVRRCFAPAVATISVDLASRLGTAPGVYCDPDIVPNVERDAVRTACQLALSLHLARFSAAHDALTNIANRRTFDSSLQASCVRSSRYGWAFTLVLADLNGFKAINDSLGHAVGDDLLRQFGLAMRRSVRSGDVAARIGGDEFGVILSNADGHDSSGFTDRLRSHLGSVRELVGFTIGTASSPRDSTDPAELFRIADARLYEKKGFNHR